MHYATLNSLYVHTAKFNEHSQAHWRATCHQTPQGCQPEGQAPSARSTLGHWWAGQWWKSWPWCGQRVASNEEWYSCCLLARVAEVEIYSRAWPDDNERLYEGVIVCGVLHVTTMKGCVVGVNIGLRKWTEKVNGNAWRSCPYSTSMANCVVECSGLHVGVAPQCSALVLVL